MRPYPPPTYFPPRGSLPVLLSVPHAGRDYDDAILANAALGRWALEALEDSLVDRLCGHAIDAGLGTVVQNVPRAVIDCNRDEEEIDPAAVEGVTTSPVGLRARHGLGLIPSRTLQHGRLWRRRVDRAELDRRLDEVHRPYHRLLADELAGLARRFGEALLIDCHSMPSRAGQADIVLGDRHGSSAASWLTIEAARIAREAGYRVALNDPYAGGAIIGRHGRPVTGIHALQIEFDRSTYLARDGRSPGPGLDRAAGFLASLAVGLGEFLLSRGMRDAAE